MTILEIRAQKGYGMQGSPKPRGVSTAGVREEAPNA